MTPAVRIVLYMMLKNAIVTGSLEVIFASKGLRYVHFEVSVPRVLVS